MERKEGAKKLRDAKRALIRGALKSVGMSGKSGKKDAKGSKNSFDIHRPQNIKEFDLLFEINDVDIETAVRRPIPIFKTSVAIAYQTRGKLFEGIRKGSIVIALDFCKTEDELAHCFTNGRPELLNTIKSMDFWPIAKKSVFEGRVPPPSQPSSQPSSEPSSQPISEPISEQQRI
jgi:hypothetical protein